MSEFALAQLVTLAKRTGLLCKRDNAAGRKGAGEENVAAAILGILTSTAAQADVKRSSRLHPCPFCSR